MRIYECADYRAMSRRAASLIAAQVVLKPEGVLGLATGSTPIGLYSQLVEWYKQGDLSFAGIRSVNLDEYLGLAPTHEQSYRYFMQQNLFDHIDIKPENTHVLNGLAAGLANRRFARFALPSLPVYPDLGQVLLVERLPYVMPIPVLGATQTFGGTTIIGFRHMGIKSIMGARRILVVVSGEDKADAVCKAVTGPVTDQVPASVLQLHPDVTLVGDTAALSKLKEAGVPVCG